MLIQEILSDKNLKPKQKTELLVENFNSNIININLLLDFASKAKDSDKATCIEVLEFATKMDPKVGNLECLNFAAENLKSKAPRVKWESAKVIGNIAHLFPDELEEAIKNLLDNTEHSGTVVRWSAAYALGEIIKTKHSKTAILIPAIKNIADNEEKNSIKKIYLAALKKVESK